MSRETIEQALFFCVAGAAQEGDSVVINCTNKTTQNGGECRSILRSNASAARDLRPKEGDPSPIEWPRHAKPYGRFVFNRVAGAAQDGDSVVVNCTTKTLGASSERRKLQEQRFFCGGFCSPSEVFREVFRRRWRFMQRFSTGRGGYSGGHGGFLTPPDAGWVLASVGVYMQENADLASSR